MYNVCSHDRGAVATTPRRANMCSLDGITKSLYRYKGRGEPRGESDSIGPISTDVERPAARASFYIQNTVSIILYAGITQ